MYLYLGQRQKEGSRPAEVPSWMKGISSNQAKKAGGNPRFKGRWGKEVLNLAQETLEALVPVPGGALESIRSMD